MSSDMLETLNIDLARRFVQIGVGLVASRAAPSQVTGIDEPVAKAPLDFPLLQNYPNSFNSQANIEFRIPRSGENIAPNFRSVRKGGCDPRRSRDVGGGVCGSMER
jgi:hypothetical protein